MRLHSMTIRAFGPFVDSVEVDFDALSEAGLFLLSGPTGAGKSSVLDAVCFALYGDVPGDRSTAGRLRCDQAAEGVASRVQLEVTLSGRRFRIERSPRWDRPKKRGTGMTTEQASVVVSELLDDVWQPLTTRLDEAGHLVTGLVGLTLTQFCQVAMLPQGRFQAFLRAKSEERHALLRQVFRTSRFDRIEGWLRDRRLALQRDSQAHAHEVAQLVGRMSEAAAESLPLGWDIADLAHEAAKGDIESWTHELLTTSTGHRDQTRQGRIEADRRATEAASAVDLARTTSRLQRAHGDAMAVLGNHDSAAHDELRRRATRADRVEPLAELDANVAEAAATSERLHRQATERMRAWRALSTNDPTGVDQPDPELDELPTLLAGAHRALDTARALRPDADRLVEVTGLCDEVATGLRDVSATAAALEQQLSAAPARLRQAEESLASADAASARLASTASDLASAQARVDATVELAALRPDLGAAKADRDAARADVVLLKERWLAIREARLDGMAAEIASGLAVGGCCPVCGSAEHPRLAVSAPGSPDAAAERALRKQVDDAEALLVALDDQLRHLETQQARLLSVTASCSALDAHQALDQAQRLHQETDALASTAGDLRDHVAEQREAQGDLVTQRDEAVQRRVDLTSRLELHTAERDRLRTLINAFLNGSGATTLPELVDLRTNQLDALSELCAAYEEVARADRDLSNATRALSAATSGAGFTSVDDARSARLEPDERRRLDEQIAGVEEKLRAARAVTGDPEHVAAAALPRPDLSALEQALEAAESASREAHSDDDEATRRLARLKSLDELTRKALTQWAPLRDELDTAARLAHFAEGKSSDNTLRMRLSAYVLAHRLSQVVAAANERLSTMSDQRYTLEHTDQRGAGETRGGLSLRVRDEWSGEARDPATLSGGETFVVSLALALGLADVITQEAGGADLDTLFVDEGFGSLDADTLEDVMSTLDGLRDGGRVVGVVSHVGEMQSRIPNQLRITKGRDGSQVHIALG